MKSQDIEKFMEIKAKFEDTDSPKSVWRDKVDAFDFFNENFEFLINIIETHIYGIHDIKKSSD